MKTTQTPAAAPSVLESRNQNAFAKFLVRCRKNWQLHLLVLIPVAYTLLFKYVPFYGLQIAFRDFRPKLGIWGSEWVGLKHFLAFFNSPNFADILLNTITLSTYSILVGFPIPVVLALMLHVSERKGLKKLTQNVAYMLM